MAYAKHNMNLSETGRALVYHRNSVTYHLNNVHVKTGLNPFNFYDLHKLVEIALKQEAKRMLDTDS